MLSIIRWENLSLRPMFNPKLYKIDLIHQILKEFKIVENPVKYEYGYRFVYSNNFCVSQSVTRLERVILVNGAASQRSIHYRME